jgi:hypothetical protein
MENDEETPNVVPPWVELEYVVSSQIHSPDRSFELLLL